MARGERASTGGIDRENESQKAMADSVMIHPGNTGPRVEDIAGPVPPTENLFDPSKSIDATHVLDGS